MKNQYELLNEAWIDFSEYEEIPFTEQEREQTMKKFRQANQKRKSTKRIAWAAACAASLALVSQTSFAKELIKQIIDIGNSSVVVYEEEQTEGNGVWTVPEELKGQIFDAEGNVLTEITADQKLYDAQGQEVVIGEDTGAEELTYVLEVVEEAVDSDHTVSFATEQELEEKLSFDLKIPVSLPEGYELEQAYTWRSEDGTVSGDYAILVYGDGSKTIQLFERRDSEETRYTASMENPTEIEFHGTTAVYEGKNFMGSWDGTIIDIMGNEDVTGEALLEVANSLE